jgi:uncharacterized protein YbcV (DUF1398 family)
VKVTFGCFEFFSAIEDRDIAREINYGNPGMFHLINIRLAPKIY